MDDIEYSYGDSVMRVYFTDASNGDCEYEILLSLEDETTAQPYPEITVVQP